MNILEGKKLFENIMEVGKYIGIITAILVYLYFLFGFATKNILNVFSSDINNMATEQMTYIITGVIFVVFVIIFNMENIYSAMYILFLFYLVATLILYVYLKKLYSIINNIFFTSKSYEAKGNTYYLLGILIFLCIYSYVAYLIFMNQNNMIIIIVLIILVYSIIFLAMGYWIVLFNLSRLKKYRFFTEMPGDLQSLNQPSDSDNKDYIEGYLVFESKDSLMIKPDKAPMIEVLKDTIKLKWLISENKDKDYIGNINIKIVLMIVSIILILLGSINILNYIRLIIISSLIIALLLDIAFILGIILFITSFILLVVPETQYKEKEENKSKKI